MLLKIFLLTAVLQAFSLVTASEPDKASNLTKRSSEAASFDQEGSAFSPQVKRRVVFWTPSTTSNPPNLFRSLFDSVYFQNLPADVREFARIFRISWNAYKNDFRGTVDFNFELMNWETNPSITGLSFATHVDFIGQILSKSSTFKNPNTWELVRKYINFTFAYYNHERPSTETLIEMLKCTAQALEPLTFKTLLQYRPAYVSDESVNIVWRALVQLASDFDVASSAKEAKRWIELFYLMSSSFGPHFKLTEYQKSPASNSKMFKRLNYLLQLQPVISAMARHDSNLFMSIFLHDKVLEIVTKLGTRGTYYWFNRFLKFDDSLRRFEPGNEEKFAALADKMFICLCATNPLARLLEECAMSSFQVLPQFLLSYSPLARKSIPFKEAQCLLLKNLVQLTQFDFDYMKIVTIVVGFDLKWADLEVHLVPNLENRFKKTPLIQGLKFILQIAESFVNGPWPVSSIASSLQIDPESPFLFDAGRIILARHFKILPIFTVTADVITEEACFRDLCWFMTFFINLYRPDLGPDFKISVEETS